MMIINDLALWYQNTGGMCNTLSVKKWVMPQCSCQCLSFSCHVYSSSRSTWTMAFSLTIQWLPTWRSSRATNATHPLRFSKEAMKTTYNRVRPRHSKAVDLSNTGFQGVFFSWRDTGIYRRWYAVALFITNIISPFLQCTPIAKFL